MALPSPLMGRLGAGETVCSRLRHGLASIPLTKYVSAITQPARDNPFYEITAQTRTAHIIKHVIKL